MCIRDRLQAAGDSRGEDAGTGAIRIDVVGSDGAGTVIEGTATGGRLRSVVTGILGTRIDGGSPTTASSGASVDVGVAMSICAAAHSWTSSINVPNAPLGWTKATVVPRDPGLGTWSMTWPPWSLTDRRTSAQSATRYPT